MALCMTSALTKLSTVHISASHPIITSNHFKHISPTNFPSFQLSLFASMLPVSFSWGHDHELRDTSFSLQHMDTWHFLSLPPRSICLWYTFFSPHRQQEGGLKKKERLGDYHFSPRPVVWSEACRSHFHSPRPLPVHRHWSRCPWASVLVQVSPMR